MAYHMPMWVTWLCGLAVWNCSANMALVACFDASVIAPFAPQVLKNYGFDVKLVDLKFQDNVSIRGDNLK